MVHTRTDFRLKLTVCCAYLLICLALYTVVDLGNRDGIDDWGHYHAASTGQLSYFSGRPLAVLPQAIVALLFDLRIVGNFAFVIFMRVASAFLLFLLVDLIISKFIWYAFLAGLMYLLYVVPDWFLIGNAYSLGDHLFPIVLLQLALYLYFRSIIIGSWRLLAVGLVVAGLSLLIRELGAPLLITVPILVFLFQRHYTFQRLLRLSIWIVGVTAASLYYVLSLTGLTGEIHSNTYLEPFSFSAFVSRLTFHTSVTLQPFYLVQASKLSEQAIAMACMIICILLAYWIVSKQLGRGESSLAEALPLSVSGLLTGLSVWFFGLLPFLVTPVGNTIDRVHAMSPLGTALIIASSIWLVSLLLKREVLRLPVFVVATLVVAQTGIAQSVENQETFYALETSWSDQAVFFRSLTHLAPEVEPDTLFFHVRRQDEGSTPYLFAQGFYYAS